jgi:putative ABC transport system permease protein
MFRNYLKTTIKYFNHHKFFSVINLIGLTTGLTVYYFAFLYVNFELSYDSFHRNADHIYRLSTDMKTASGIEYRGSSAPIGPTVKETFPEVRSATRILLDYLIVQNEKGLSNEEKIAYADSTLFSVFTFPLTLGDPSRVLNAPFNVVLSESSAAKYFGADNPIGKTLLINGKDRAYVTGVMKDMPQNSHFRVSMLVSMSTLLEAWNPSLENSWTYLRFYTYLILKDDQDAFALNQKLTGLMKAHTAREDITYLPSLEPLINIYLHGKARGHRAGSAVTGNLTNVYIFSLVAVFVLLIACVNFINLSTAFSMQRAKEIGIRKVMGASRTGLVFQFLVDAVFLSTIAFIFSLGLIVLILPLFNQISDKTVSLGIFEHPNYLGHLFFISVSAGVLSGLYPAFFLSSFQPSESLKGRFASSAKGITLRKTLVTSQFLISFVLLVATTVVFKQLDFMENQQLGFKKEHRLAIDFQFDDRAGSEGTKSSLTALPGVSIISSSSSLPGKPNHQLNTKLQTVGGEMPEFYFDAYFIDHNFLQQYGIEVIAGRHFSTQMVSDSANAMIINEACARKLGYQNPDDVIGKRFSQWGRDGVIIGVVRDFHFQSFREEVRPLTFQLGGISTFMTLTIVDADLSSSLSEIERKWKEIVPDIPISYFFTDEAYNSMYNSEKRFGQLFVCFVTIAIIIFCLGLFGLSAFSTVQRTKEIGIRKVLGSSTLSLVALLSRDFFKLIALALLFGIPLAWLTMERWLQEFAYRIDLSFWFFILASLILAFIAFLTMSFQIISAAKANPVKSLKTE